MEKLNSIVEMDRREQMTMETLAKLDRETRREMLANVEQRRQEAMENLNALSLLKIQLSILEADDGED